MCMVISVCFSRAGSDSKKKLLLSGTRSSVSLKIFMQMKVHRFSTPIFSIVSVPREKFVYGREQS